MWAGVGDEDLSDVVVLHFVNEPVGAQQLAFAANERESGRVGPHIGLDAKRIGNDVASWVIAGFVAGDLALVDEILHERVIFRDLA